MPLRCLLSTGSFKGGAGAVRQTLFLLLLLAAVFLDIQAAPQLKFREDGKFKVVVFADLHYGENAWDDWGPRQDRNSDRVMASILDAEKPDLVIYLGDLVTANNVPLKNATAYWKQAIAPAEARGIPWASIFGNHDDMAFEWPAAWFGPSGIPAVVKAHCMYYQGTTREELMTSELDEALSMSSSGPKSLWPSVSNYFFSVSSSSGNASSASTVFYFLDSGGGSYPEVISSSQVEWFKDVSNKLNPQQKIPEIVFWHIPSQAFSKVGPRPKAAVSPPCVGSINFEAVASQSAEWGMMDVLRNRTSVKAVVVGHNHGLDWCCPDGNVWLCFARHSGYGGYGSWTRGARVIEILGSQHARTWINLEDGTIKGLMSLW